MSTQTRSVAGALADQLTRASQTVDLVLNDLAAQPPTSLPALQAYEEIQKIDDLDWTAISPPASIPAGQRTGKFKRGLDKLIENAKGESRISREDFAVAIVDEIEKPKHIRKRFTVGY